MYGAVFGDRYSREDYGAVMNYARVTPPAVKEVYVDIDGGDSAIDLTEAVGGCGYMSFFVNKCKYNYHYSRISPHRQPVKE